MYILHWNVLNFHRISNSIEIRLVGRAPGLCTWSSLCLEMAWHLKSSAPCWCQCDFKNVIFNLALLIGILKSSYDNILRWMPQDITGGKSTLVQVMAWCCQATSHYLNQCWPRSLTPYGITRPQWVKVAVVYKGANQGLKFYVHIHDFNFVITVSVDGLAPNDQL